MSPNNWLLVTMLLQIAEQRASNQASVTSNVDGTGRHRTSLVQANCIDVKPRHRPKKSSSSRPRQRLES
jgi:hypothetical protein